MYITRLSDNIQFPVVIERADKEDFKIIRKREYSFNWKAEEMGTIYKLKMQDHSEILGLVSIESIENEKRVEIKLLEVAKRQRGADKLLDRIAGNLIAYAARLAVKEYGAQAAVSLVPKTVLAKHYKSKYGFQAAGKSLFIADENLWSLLRKYDYDK